jgi:hypothetical protein
MIRLVGKPARFMKTYRLYLALAFLGAEGEAPAGLLQPWPLKTLFNTRLLTQE